MNSMMNRRDVVRAAASSLPFKPAADEPGTVPAR